MIRSLLPLLALLAPAASLAAAPTSAPQGEDAQQGAAAQQGASLDPQVAAQLDAAVADGLQDGELDALYRAAVLAAGDAAELLEAVRARQEGADAVAEDALRWLEVGLLRRRGQLAAALGAVERMPGLDGDAAAQFELGRLQDALGRRDAALATYARALELLPEGDPREIDLRLRMALLSMESGDEESQDALADFARGDGIDDEMANRAAVVLALLGRPKEASDLFEVGDDPKTRFRQEVRIAEWALDAGEPAVAQEYAWRALASAGMNRDRWYALTVLVEAHRADDSLARLIERFGEAEELSEPATSTWIALLRETERYDEAMALFRDESERQGFPPEMRRELLAMYREAGRDAEMVEQYRELMEAEPRNWMWPEGLARYYLEQGDTDAARALWQGFVEECPPGPTLIAGAQALMGLGQDDLARRCAERCIEDGRSRYAAYLFLFDLHRFRGELARAEAALDRMHEAAPEDAPERMQLAESYERIGNLRRAVEVLEGLRDARGPAETGEDLEMRLAWLHSEVGDEELALERWRELWRRVDSVPRRRYVEDRMMTVAARLGRLADIAIDLERKLYAGEADDRDSGLLVRLYTKVGDPVSATEIIEEHLKHSGGDQVEALQEKARVFLACTDYHNYEKTVRELIAVDPEGEADYLRQIAMSMLERGKPDQARDILERLKELDGGGNDSFEFEAGVLALAGMRSEAITAYRRGLAEVPDRIESYLLMADLMREIGLGDRAVGMFQHLAETADKDDLFTIAIDGLLNLEAPQPVMQWARRVTLERLARRHDAVYLYQLLNDLGEEVNDMEARYAALEGQLPIAGDRRASVVRELMDLAAGSTSFFGRRTPADPERHLAYGRRLIGLGQLVPPQVYLDLGRVFLDNGDVADAAKTFALARDLPDLDQFQRETAALFEEARFLREALTTYKKVLIGDAGNVGLLVKVAELEEQLGDDAAAAHLYLRATELLLSRRPLVAGKDEEEGDAFSRWFARNVDEFDTYYERAVKGLLVTLSTDAAQELAARHAALLGEDLERAVPAPGGEEALPLARYPRLLHRGAFVRRLALSFGRMAPADRADRALLEAFPDDDALLEELVRARVRWGMTPSARQVLADSGRPEQALRKLRFLVGDGVDSAATELVPVDEAMRQVLPLLSAGRDDEVRSLLRRIDFAGIDKEKSSGDLSALFSAALYLQDPDLTLYLGRNWVRVLMTGERPSASYEVQPVLDRCTLALEGDLLLSLYQYYVQLILEDPEQRGEHLRAIPELQERLEVPLIEGEQLADLLVEHGSRLYFTMAPLLRLAPAEERATLTSQVWSEVAPTMRRYFLFNLVGDMGEPFGEELEGLLAEWFEEVFQDAEISDIGYQLDDLASEEVLAYAGDLVLRIYELAARIAPDDQLAPALRALALWRLGREEEALPLALDAYFSEQLRESTDYYYRNTRRQIEDSIFPEEPEPFLARMDELDAESAPDVARCTERLDLVRRLEDPELLLAETRKAAALHPDDLGLQRRLLGELSSNGLRDEEEALFAALLERFPEDVQLAQQAFNRWSGRVHPVRAAAALDRWQALEAEQPEEQARAAGGGQVVQVMTASGPQQMMITPEGALVPIGGDEKDDGRVAPATVVRLKEKVDEEAWEEARNQLRRLWRTYPRDDRSSGGIVYYFGSSSAMRMDWPADREEVEPTAEEKAEQEALAKVRRRGGLAAYGEEVSERPEPKSAYEVLSQYDFAVDEMRRQVRTSGPAAMESLGPVIEGLAEARVREQGAGAAIAGLIELATDGAARRVELLQLLALLEEHPEEVGPEARSVLDELERSLHPRDGAQLLRLARVMAATGERQRAVDLYRWCATQTSATRYFSTRQQEYGTIPLQTLVSEVKEVLEEGEDMVQVIEEVLRYSSPVQYPWEREQHQQLMLDTWTELMEPAQALERCAEIVAEADSREQPLRRGVADKAAWLYAHEGQLERALACMEAALCEFPARAFSEDRWYRQYRYPARAFSAVQMRRFLPADVAGWKEPAAWPLALGEALLDWAAEERIPEYGALTGAALAAVRAYEAGDVAGAQALLQRAAGMLDEQPGAALWVADAARQVGLAELGDSIEAALLEERTLNVHRIADVLARMEPAAALAAGAELRDYTLQSDMLDTLVAAAETAQDPAAVETWTTLRGEAEAAEAKIEAWREEQKRKAEEAKR